MEQKKNEPESTPGSKKISDIKSRVFNGRHPKARSLVIDRVPADIVEVFKKFANDEFCGDYGLCLKKLVDLVLIEPLPFMQINAVLESHEERLCKIEKGLNGPAKDNKKRALTGSKEVYSGQRGTEKKEGIENE